MRVVLATTCVLITLSLAQLGSAAPVQGLPSPNKASAQLAPAARCTWAARLGKSICRTGTSIRTGGKNLWCKIRGKDPDPIVRVKIGYRTVGNWGTASMLMSGANEAIRLGASNPVTAPLTGFGAVGLGVYSVRGLIKADNAEKRLDATHGIAWSLQGMAGLGKVLQSRVSWVGPAATTMGVAGGVIQTGVGGYRVVTGVRRKDRPRVILGCLDVSAGLCWVASACSIANPYTLGGFVVLASARMAYAKRSSLKSFACRIRDGFRRCRGATTGAIGAPASAQPATPSEPEHVIVTAPQDRRVVERAAQEPGTIQVNDTSGRTAAVIIPATAKTSSGKEKPALVVTPVRQEQPSPAP